MTFIMTRHPENFVSSGRSYYTLYAAGPTQPDSDRRNRLYAAAMTLPIPALFPIPVATVMIVLPEINDLDCGI
jgi:hypothetical protein